MYPEGFFDRPVRFVLLDMIYIWNKIRIHEKDIKFYKAKKLDQRPDRDDDPDSYIDVKIKLNTDRRFQGNNGFMYKRVPLSEVITNDVVEQLTFPFYVHDVLPLINAGCRTNFTKRDLYNDYFETPSEEVKIRAKPASQIWVDEGVFRSVGEMIPLNRLDGFVEYTGPVFD